MRTGFDQLRAQIDYEKHLRRLDARAVLEHYGARNCQEQINSKDGTTEIIHSCLLDRVHPHHSNGDQNPSAACNLDKKTYVCYSMGYGCDLFHLIQKLEGREALDLMDVGKFLTGSTVDTSVLKAELEKILASTTVLSDTLPVYDDSVLNGFRHLHPYWEERGIDPLTQEMLNLGYDPKEKRIVFPHYFGGHLVGWQKRCTPQSVPQYPKYLSSFSFPKSTTLYNYDRTQRYSQVVVVESPMSVARAITCGLPNVVATFGAKVSAAQIRLLHPFSTVFVWFDHEVYAGQIGERKITEGLYRHTDVRVVVPDEGRDMGDEDLAGMERKINGAIPAALRLGEHDLAREMR